MNHPNIILICAGCEIPECVEGKSLLPAIRGKQSEIRPYLHGEHAWAGQSLQWLTDGREKYVWLSGAGHEQLFDLENDPQELHDCARDTGRQESVKRWRRILVKELDGREEGYSDGEKLITGQKPKTCLQHIL